MHQNLTFPVHPDPVSGMHCWHQKVRIEPAAADDRHGDVFVDTNKYYRCIRSGSRRPARRPDQEDYGVHCGCYGQSNQLLRHTVSLDSWNFS